MVFVDEVLELVVDFWVFDELPVDGFLFGHFGFPFWFVLVGFGVLILFCLSKIGVVCLVFM